MPIVRTSAKYQIAIPKSVRKKLNLEPGQELLVDEKDGAIVLTPVPSDPIEFLRGIFKGEPSLTKELLEERARDREHD